MLDVSLSQIFAIVPTTVSRYIEFTLGILLFTLKHMKDARIQWPVGNEFEENNSHILARHPLLIGAFGSMDGLNLPIQTSQDQEVENATFNGWLQEHFISSVFAFGADGVIIACNLNAPGSWHDSRVAWPIYEKLCSRTPDGYYLVTDTAFPRGTDQIAGRIRAPMKDGTRLLVDEEECNHLLQYDRQLLSYRQTAEWGMHAMQGSFGHLRVPLAINHSDLRGDLLETVSRLFNLCARAVGHSQIRTVYMPIWREDEQEELWMSFEGMLFSEQQRNDRVGRFHLVASE
ncbi:hypothetical protein L208DRAFT_1545663 [Tricholoma matsutake]|nr:hypothetical protein L208DRAFT_1545663 [Tricholoma matsutake 945]